MVWGDFMFDYPIQIEIEIGIEIETYVPKCGKEKKGAGASFVFRPDRRALGASPALARRVLPGLFNGFEIVGPCLSQPVKKAGFGRWGGS
jgi:hypothetical protein